MSASEIVVHVELRRRSLWGRLTRAPFVWVKHYRELRRANGRLVSAYAAWLLARSVVTFNGKAVEL